MGKLNIAHHKSYHPYRRDNIERVRRDEEEARLKEAVQEGRMMLAVCKSPHLRHILHNDLTFASQDSEARIDLLRQRAGLAKPPTTKHQDDGADEHREAVPSSIMSGGHINLFEDIERVGRLFMHCCRKLVGRLTSCDTANDTRAWALH